MSKEIRKKVLKVVREAEIPIDVEKIARRINIGWGTALRYALELVMSGKIRGLKTSKSWVFWENLSQNIEEVKDVGKKRNSGIRNVD
jgi:DNA helicase TIP49 (TBP-interacting protein)